MNKIKRLATAALLGGLSLLLLAGPAAAEKLVPKVDSFILFVDHSGSMNMTHKELGQKKLIMAKKTLAALNKDIPELSYQAGLFTFAPFGVELAMGPYSKPKTAAAIDGLETDYDIFGRNTPMGLGLRDLDPVLAGLGGEMAVIMVTDGDSNYGLDPVAEVKALYAKYPDLCVHIISYADNDRGRMIIDEIRALRTCTVYTLGQDLDRPGNMDKFVRDVFYDLAPEEAPRPAAVPETEVITFRSMNFGFDKYQITEEMVPALEFALEMLNQRPGLAVTIEGHTDFTGPEQYNQGLSERRAASVAKWLEAHGVDRCRMETIGYGELNPKYDNHTREGRKLNRRVEIKTKQ
ncbi:MAG: OmpA family protein [Desulfovibrionaceae bacterium]|nr:OmpA family protein [Desulfovibrionaceae bacterium]